MSGSGILHLIYTGVSTYSGRHIGQLQACNFLGPNIYDHDCLHLDCFFFTISISRKLDLQVSISFRCMNFFKKYKISVCILRIRAVVCMSTWTNTGSKRISLKHENNPSHGKLCACHRKGLADLRWPQHLTKLSCFPLLLQIFFISTLSANQCNENERVLMVVRKTNILCEDKCFMGVLFYCNVVLRCRMHARLWHVCSVWGRWRLVPVSCKIKHICSSKVETFCTSI